MNIKEKLLSDKVKHWGKLISITGGAQFIVQATTILCGFLIVRLLSVEEYAYYTLANTMLGTMTILADGGISSGVMAEGGKVWKDRNHFGKVLTTGLELRKKFAIVSLIISIPVLFYLLIQHNASILTCILICIALIPAFIAALSDTLYQIPLKLHQDIQSLQKNQLFVAIGRFILSVLSLLILPWTAMALLANGIPRSVGNINLKKLSDKFSNLSEHSDPEIKKSILKIVSRIMPTAIYYCISGQITIWLISFFGNTSTLASFGALSRISAITAVFATLFTTIMVPRFARLVENKALLVKAFVIDQLFIFVLCILFLIAVYFFSGIILWFLGDSYKGLSTELLLISLGSCISVISQCTNALLAARGLIIPPLLLITSTIIVQVAGIFIFNVSTFKGVIFYGMSTTTILYTIRIIYFTNYINKIHLYVKKN